MYAGYVALTKTHLATLTNLQKQYAALKYSGGDKWKKIGTGFTTLFEYADKWIQAEKEKSYKGQEGYTSLFPPADSVGKITAEHADELAEAAKKYYDAHKDPKSWLEKNKKAEKARAELTSEIMDACKKLSLAGKSVKAGKFEPPSIDKQEAFVEARKGYAKLAKETATEFKNYLEEAKKYLKEGGGSLGKAEEVAVKIAKESEKFKKNPIFLASRGSMPKWPDGVDDDVIKKMEKEALDSFEAGMRSSAQMTQYEDEIETIVLELKGLAEEAEYANINAQGCLTKLENMRKEYASLKGNNKVSKMAGFEWSRVSSALTKLVETYEKKPEAGKGFRDGYISKRNEIVERMDAAKVAVASCTTLKKRVEKVPTPTKEVTQAKTELLKDITELLKLPTTYYASANDLKVLVGQLNPRVGE